MTHLQMSRKGGKSGIGASKARTPEQASAAAKARWKKCPTCKGYGFTWPKGKVIAKCKTCKDCRGTGERPKRPNGLLSDRRGGNGDA
jgi:DnaJ-class molecular chaperone